MCVRDFVCFFFFQAEDGIRDLTVTGVQTCALPIFRRILRDVLPHQDPVLVFDEELSREPRLPPELVEHCAELRVHVRQRVRSEEHMSELQSQSNLVCRLPLEKKNNFITEIKSTD